MKALLDLHAISRQRAAQRRKENSTLPERRAWSGERWLDHGRWLDLTDTDRLTWRNVTDHWRV